MIHSEHQVRGILEVINAMRECIALSPYECKFLLEAERLFLEAAKAHSEGILADAERAGTQAMNLIERLDEKTYGYHKEAIRSLVVL